MEKYIRIELVNNEISLHAMLEDQRLGVINNKNILAIEDNPDLPSGVSIGPQMVENFIKEVHISTIGEKTTLVRAVLVNGFEVIESSACVDKANYNENIGAEVCMKKIKDKIWFLLGFLLQSAVGGVK
ncbi:Gp49 family protein [Clostridium sp. BSD9I1]|uniref:Gp49 family protein n=1 Tax=Clostridium sp. BSD9I1 TaxID=2003589 RepID=UPI001644A8D5